MIRIEIEQSSPTGRRELEVHWTAVPRIGDSVDTQTDAVGVGPPRLDYPHGTVKTVVWWRDGSVRVVLEAIRL